MADINMTPDETSVRAFPGNASAFDLTACTIFALDLGSSENARIGCFELT